MTKKISQIDGKVFITLNNGPYAGQTREVSDADPMQLLSELTRSRYKWILDLSEADAIQRLEWGRAELVHAILGALRSGRPVRFNKEIYMATNPSDLADVVGKVEDAIGESGFNVFLESDDENGVSIGIHSKEASKN